MAKYAPAALTAPVAVGQRVHVLHSYTGTDYRDLGCGDTTVVEVRRNGSFTLANGFKFRANGQGLACNNHCCVGAPRLPHNNRNLPLAAREEHYVAYRAQFGESEAAARASWRSDTARQLRGW